MAPCLEREREEAGGSKEEEDDEGGEEAQSHLPLAPSSELLFDISTTVDPSYIISLIRRLIPCDVKVEKDFKEINNNENAVQRSEMYSLDQATVRIQNREEMMIAAETPDTLGSDGIGMEENSGVYDDRQGEHPDIKDPWEDSGCILWDLSASKTHAELMVSNFLLEVLLANLQVPKSFRVTEICLGIIGNLACHNDLSEMITSTGGLIETIVSQLFLDDSTCLSETFRLLAVGLQGSGCAFWSKVLSPEQILQRILWIIGNTLNSILLERGIEFLLAIADKQEVASILLPPLSRLGLPNVVVSVLSCEIINLRDENKLERCSILDTILRLVETLSTADNFPQVISSNGELLHLVSDVVKLPDKIELACSCVSAVVIIANLLVDEEHLASGLVQDLPFLQGLLDIFPFVSDDLQARNALWSILARLLSELRDLNMSASTVQLVSIFLDKSSLIEEDLDDHPMNDYEDHHGLTASRRSSEIVTALKRLGCILEKWIAENPGSLEEDVAGSDEDIGKVHRLLSYCRKRGGS